MAAYRKLCFEYGTSVFWLVHPEDRTVAVTRRDEPARTVTFEMDDSIPLAPLANGLSPVNDLFAR